MIETLGKVHVNHAVLREAELVVIGNVNLAALFRKLSQEKKRNGTKTTWMTIKSHRSNRKNRLKLCVIQYLNKHTSKYMKYTFLLKISLHFPHFDQIIKVESDQFYLKLHRTILYGENCIQNFRVTAGLTTAMVLTGLSTQTFAMAPSRPIISLATMEKIWVLLPVP